MAPRKHKPALASPGSLGDLDYLDGIAKPAKPQIKTAITEELVSAPPEPVASASPAEGSSAKRQASRISKHHVSLYISPAVDRAFKQIALDEKVKAWEIYHAALREYLDRTGQSFDELMSAD